MQEVIGVKKQKANTEEASLEKSRFFERTFRSIERVLRPEHDLTQRVNEFFRTEVATEGMGNVQVNIYEDRHKSAFAFPHGAIYMSSSMLDSLETEEQLIFLLGHEAKHLDKKKKALAKSDTLFAYLTEARLEEYSADASGFLNLEEQGRNPLEGIDVLEKLSEGEKYGGPVHGDTIHRILNLFWITRLMDLSSIDKATAELNIEVPKRFEKYELAKSVIPDIDRLLDVSARRGEQYDEIQKCNLESAIAAYQRILERSGEVDISQTGRIMINEHKEELHWMIRNYAEGVIQDFHPDIGGEETSERAYYLSELVRAFCCGEDDITFADINFNRFLETINPAYFKALNIVPVYDNNVESFTENLGFVLKDKKRINQLKKKTKFLFDELSSHAETAFEEAKIEQEIDEKMMEYEDVFQEETTTRIGGTDIRLHADFVMRLLSMPSYEAVKELYMAQPFITEDRDNEKLYFITNSLDDDYGVMVNEIFKKLPEKEALLEKIKAYKVLALGDMNALEEIFSLYKSITMDDFRDICRHVLDDRVTRKSYPFQRNPIPFENAEFDLNSIRFWLLRDAKNNEERLRILYESLEIHPNIETAEVGYEEYKGLLEDILDNFEPNRINYELVFALSAFQAPLVKSYIQRQVLPKLMEGMDFEEAYTFIKRNLRNISTVEPIEDLIEKKANTLKDLRKLGQSQNEIAKLMTEKAETGNVFLFEVLQKISTIDRLDALAAVVGTDYDLKRFMYLQMKRVAEQAKDSEKLKQERYKEGADVSEDSANERFYAATLLKPIGGLLNTDQYYSTDLSHKAYLLHMLLVDPVKGILMRDQTKKQLTTRLIDEMVTSESDSDTKIMPFVETVLDSLVQNAPMHLSYFALWPLLLDKVFKPGERADSFDVVFDVEIEEYNRKAKKISEEDVEYLREFMAELIGTKKFKDATYDERLGKSMFFDGFDSFDKEVKGRYAKDERVKDMIDWDSFLAIIYRLPNRGEHLESGGTIFDKVNEITGIKHSEEQDNGIKKLSALEFVCECAKNLGSYGVRFLQLMGQYADIPEEYQKEFQKVYDNLHGQSKLTAHNTVQREWKTFARNIKTMGTSVGGGSLTTVYPTERIRNGGMRVLKVLNPNIGYFNDLAYEVIRETLEGLAKQDPKYQLGVDLLADIKEWVDGDISFAGFIKKDKKFFDTHNGAEGAAGYTVLVPKSYGPENKHYKQEDLVEGTNLTEIDELRRQGHDIKAIVSTIAQNYIEQIGHGIVHADVHPGNFRVTEDRKVGILDRNYFLEFSNEEKDMLFPLIHYAESKEGAADAAKIITTYLSQIEENKKSLSNGISKELRSTLEEEFGSSNPLADKLMNVVRYLRVNDIKVPIKTTLLIRNLHSLQKLSLEAGFNSLEECFQYN